MATNTTLNYGELIHKSYPQLRAALQKPFVKNNPAASRYIYETLELLQVNPAFAETELMGLLTVGEGSSSMSALKGAAYLIEEAYPDLYVLRQVRDTWYIVNTNFGVM